MNRILTYIFVTHTWITESIGLILTYVPKWGLILNGYVLCFKLSCAIAKKDVHTKE